MQITLALHEIHRRKEGKILHRDIKPSNVFLEANNSIKLGDFGLAKISEGNSMKSEFKEGTPLYMAPECINDNKYIEKSEIWSLGCLLYELATLSPPFSGSNQFVLAKKINSGKFEKIPSKYSHELSRIIN